MLTNVSIEFYYISFSVVIFINILQAAFTGAKKTDSLTVFFVLLGSAARKTLVKLVL